MEVEGPKSASPASATMTTTPPTETLPPRKRPRLDDSRDETPTTMPDAMEIDGEEPTGDVEDTTSSAQPSTTPTLHGQARRGLQRSIAMVLRHDGFETATPEAMESFTNIVETYLHTLIVETGRFAAASRREHPVPSDFEAVFRRFNLPTSSLKPHLHNPLPAEVIAPRFESELPIDPDAYTTLPLLSEELSGQADKDNMPHIPASFPDFPSRHTYRFTEPEDVAAARDSQKIREEAARTAQQGEEALRRLVRASKMRKQKEAKSLVERDEHGRERFRLWEATMRKFVATEDGSSTGVVDHSMIVNGDSALFARKEVSRLSKRTAVMGSHGA